VGVEGGEDELALLLVDEGAVGFEVGHGGARFLSRVASVRPVWLSLPEFQGSVAEGFAAGLLSGEVSQAEFL
jgi:hypothetical protein